MACRVLLAKLVLCGFVLSFVKGTSISDLSFTFVSSCASSSGGAIKCWGDVKYLGLELGGDLPFHRTYFLGDGPNEMGLFLPEVDLGTNRTVKQLARGRSLQHTCAVLDQGAIKCWGLSLSGALGGTSGRVGDTPGQMGDALQEVDLGTNRTAVQVALGFSHTCAILDTGDVKCWGSSQDGALGGPYPISVGKTPLSMGDYIAPINLGTDRTALQVACGNQFTCVILDNHQVKCWGRGGLGQLGNGDNGNVGDSLLQMGDNLKEVDLGTNRTAIQIECGDNHVCVLLDNHQMKCWGDGDFGQLGSGRSPPYQVGNQAFQMGDNLPAVDLGEGLSVLQISTGNFHTCALLSNHQAKCFGKGNLGALGQGNTDTLGDGPYEMGDNLSFIDVGQYRSVVSLHAGDFRSCAILDNGALKCWGPSIKGLLGYGDTLGRGAAPGTMGDALPSVDLAFGNIPPSPAPSISPTSSPVRPPSESPTRMPTFPPTLTPTSSLSVVPTRANTETPPPEPEGLGTVLGIVVPLVAIAICVYSAACGTKGSSSGSGQAANFQQRGDFYHERRRAPIPTPEESRNAEGHDSYQHRAPQLAVAVTSKQEGELPVAKIVRPSL